MINNNDIYGASLIISAFLGKKYALPESLIHFIAIHEFEKYVRYHRYDIYETDIFSEIMIDISDFNLYTKVALPADLEFWIKANFSHMLGVINGTESESAFEG